jgi:hypothetical protein
VGEAPRQGVFMEGAWRGEINPQLSVIHKNATKNRWFPILLDIKISENAVSSTKLLNKIYLQHVFEAQMNFKNLRFFKQS